MPADRDYVARTVVLSPAQDAWITAVMQARQLNRSQVVRLVIDSARANPAALAPENITRIEGGADAA